MKNPRQIIIRPMITEKGTRLREGGNQYLFEVETSANKIDIKKAVEEIFSVNVLAVRTMQQAGKPRRMGRFMGRTNKWKKAVVTLGEGQTIDAFDTV